jgi:hypothetical protein
VGVSAAAWIVLALLALPLIGFLVWMLLDESFVRIDSGKLGLLVVKGKATDTTLLPGPHWVPSLRRRSVVEYPSLELSYRAGDVAGGAVDATAPASDLERSGPALAVTLGDRAEGTVSYTVRFRLVPEQLRSVHERFGPDGLWAIVRDEADRAVAAALAAPGRSIDDLFAAARATLEADLAEAVGSALSADGFRLTLFRLGRVDLGRAGDTIQGAVRARYELEREQADAVTRLARARNDAELSPYLEHSTIDAALRYREADLWREMVARPDGVSVVLPAGASTPSSSTVTEPGAGEGEPPHPVSTGDGL